MSVIIPTYNRANIVATTIDNVFEQTFRDFELIVVDDGSTDTTQHTLRRYGNRIRVITQDNAGPAVARNNGVKAARGNIIAFQDSDDLWHPAKLERQVHLLEAYKTAPCCLCNVLLKMVDGKAFTSFDHSVVRFQKYEGLWINVLEVLCSRFILFNQASAIRRSAFEKAGGFPEDLKYLEDYELPLRLALAGAWAFIREPLVYYGHGSPDSFSEQAKRDFALLKRCELEIYGRMLSQTKDKARYAQACRSLRRRSAVTRRQLLAAKLNKTNSLVLKCLANLLAWSDHYWMAAVRRSPFFPQPITIEMLP